MMAAGAEWSRIIKPFVTQCDGTKADIIELCSAIVKRESEILHHKENSKTFYNSFAVLAANRISSHASLLSASQLDLVSAACRVLLKYLVGVLETVSLETTPSTVQASRYLNAIRSLCLGICLLSESENAVITASMKGENLPIVNANQTGTENTTKIETTKTRCDLSVTIFEQLTLPYRDGRLVDWPPSSERTGGHESSIPSSSDPAADPATEINKLFLSANTESLQSLRAGDTLVDLCLSLQSLKRAKSKCDEAIAGKHFSLPSTHSEAAAARNSLPSTLSDISLAMAAISLPVLEPLTTSKLDKLSALCMAGLHCAVSQAAANSVLGMGSAISPKCTQAQSQTTLKDDDLESSAVSLVEEAIAMFDYVGLTIKNSTRAGGHVYQNHLLAGAWVLVSGLQTHLSSSTALVTEKGPHTREDKGRSPSKNREPNSARTSLMKFQQGFGVLSVALANKALNILSELMDDLRIEINGSITTAAPTTGPIDPVPLSMMSQYTALQRVARVLTAAPLNTLLFYLATVSYRKACTLKRIQKHTPTMAPIDGADTFSQSDSTTYYEDLDMIMCSGESSTDDDDDSEPILGQWFEETLAPPENATSNENLTNADNQDVNKPVPSERTISVVPEKGEPHGYICLATQIFVFMNKHFLSTKCSYVTRYVMAGLQEQQMIILAAIIRDLDRETARTEIGTISVHFGTALGQLYTEFSGALTRFTHNLVTHSALNSLQAILLGQLGISPWNADVPHSWPLQVYPRTLAVLAQVLLLRPQNEKEASIISIWHRLVNTLVESVINPPTQIDLENEDLNVEHLQVLLYLFHSLNLMQKKSVLLLMAGGVVRCSEVARGNLRDSQLLHLSRLLLMLDYIMKNLYDAPSVLLEHMQWNLFYSTNFLSPPSSTTQNSSSDNANVKNHQSRLFTSWPDIEDNYRKHLGSTGVSDDFHMKPRFYAITNTTLEINNQETPKLDGLACNFVLGTPDKLRYPLLLDALIEILNVTNVSGNGKLTFQGLCATQYCFTICWKLLLLLPPYTSYIDQLACGETFPAGPLLLHTLIWAPRSGHRTFSRWMRDGLIKQGTFAAHAEILVQAVADVVSNLKYDVNVAKSCIAALTPDVKKGTIVTKESLPPLWHLFLLDAIFAKVQVSLIDDTEAPNSSTSNDQSVVTGTTLVQDLLPHVLRITQAILYCTRWALLHNMVEQCSSGEPQQKTANVQDYEGLHDILAICSSRNSLTSSLAPELNGLLPSGVCGVLQQWNSSGGAMEECTWTPYLNDIIPAESYIIKIIDTHVSTLSSQPSYTIKTSLKRVLQCLIKFICQHAPKTDNTDTKNKAIELLVQLTLDTRTEFLHETVSKTLDKMIGDTETLEHQKRVYLLVLEHTYQLITNYTANQNTNYGAFIEEKVLHNCLKFMEKLLEKSSGRQALESFYVGDSIDLVKVLMSVSNQQMSQNYGTRVLHFFNKLFQAAEKSPADPSLNYLCGSMSKLAQVDSEKLQTWLRHVILGPCNMISSVASSNVQTVTATTKPATTEDASNKPSTDVPKLSTEGSSTNQWSIVQIASTESNASPSPSDDHKSLVQENSQLLQALTTFIVKPNSNVSEDVAVIILKALLPLGSHILSPALEGVGFPDLLVVMATLADAGTGRGHTHLFAAATEWLEICKQHITPKHQLMLESSCYLLNYVGDVLNALIPSTQGSPGTSTRALSPPWEGEVPTDVDSTDWPEEQGEDEDSGEDSDEDSLCNKLCTFTITQKEFMNQHWYHCHTCRMLDGVGVCSVCARVCHRGHDLSYAKYGNFFCDCGAKEDGTCQALVKRSPQSASDGQPIGVGSSTTSFGVEHMLTSSLRRRPSSPIPIERSSISRDKNRLRACAKQIEGSREFLLNYLSGCPMLGGLLDMVQGLIPSVETLCEKNSPVGCHTRAQLALMELHGGEKKCVNTDQLVMPRLGSQEGAFENVRMSYAGEQGQTIRQLLSAHIVRRVAMCCMTSPHSKRQHLAVSHEKGKITVLQLSALLKQADSSTRKLTLNRLASAPIPFTVLSLTGNICNEDYLAVCGLKDCHVLTFNSTGSVSDHLVLHPQLDTGNFIIKAIWLPGSQTQLALVTADFVKVYDLSKDALSPQYYFLVPSGKIRDCAFIYKESVYTILLMSSPGHIYKETLNEESSAKHGSFYVTNTLEVFHLDVTDANGQVSGGGVSIYYSHTLNLLFFSYIHGKSFVAPLKPRDSCLTLVFPITLPTPKSNGSKNVAPQPLCQWTEIPNHPGLICCVMQASNNPVILMLKPDTIFVQEIKVVPAKSKIMDIVAIRHSSGTEQRTTIILLCEDGSLKIYVANMDQTGFWMSPSIQPVIQQPNVKAPRKKKTVKSGKTGGSLSFPVDFFEHCQPMNDVEIGGNDLLQAYSLTQLKHRLNTTGLYLVCTKPLGFNVDITNNDNNLVMTGIRVLLGNQDVQRAPSFIEVFGRIITTSVSRNRWYDIPFSREESLQADKKVTVMFGPSQDPEIVTMLDSIKIYGKTKEVFGWPEETEDTTTANAQTTVQQNGNAEQENIICNPTPLSLLERFICGSLEVLDGCFCLFVCCGDKSGSLWSDDKLQMFKPKSIEVATKLLTLPTQPPLQMYSKSLLAALHSTKLSYHNYKDHALLSHVLSNLSTMRDLDNKRIADIDAESYYRLVLIVRGIAISRPQNLIKFAEQNSQMPDVTLDDPIDLKTKSINKSYQKNDHLIIQLMDVLWLLHSANPDNSYLAPVVIPGLKHTEQVVHALVEIVHAFNLHNTYSNLTFSVYLQLLLCEDPLIAFSAKLALSRVLKPKGRRRRVFIPSPPHCITPPGKTNQESEEEKPTRPSGHPSQDDDVAVRMAAFDVDPVEAMAMLQQHADSNEGNRNVNPLEALLGGAAGFPPLLDIPPDADDETMVELAIALSLQEHELGGVMQNLPQGLAGQAGHALQALANQGLAQVGGGSIQAQEAGHYSDTTASAAGSDDEGSTAATDGSTLRTSPAEQGGSAGSESGGSGVDSITGEHNVSGRSSAYGDHIQEAIALVGRSETNSLTNVNYPQTEADSLAPETEVEVETESSSKLQVLKLLLLEHLVEFLPRLREVDGVRTIPFMQVVLSLANDLDGNNEREHICLESLLKAIVVELQITNIDTKNVQNRSKFREVQLVLMRFLGVLTNRKPTAGANVKPVVSDNFVSQTAATELHKAQIISHCLKLLESMLDYWRNLSVDESNAHIGGALLKEHLSHSPPDMQPFFLRQYVKGHATDVFEGYAQLLTEMALRLPYQVHKHSELNQNVSEAFDSTWFWYLCEYMMYTQTPFVRRQVRKLLLYICGNKDKYRQLRDLHTLESHVFAVEQCCIKGGYNSKLEVQHSLSLPYDNLVELVEHLKACLEVANSRTGNWQHYCLKHANTLSFLLQVSCLLDEGVSPTILNLLHCAIVNTCNPKKTTTDATKPILPRKDREKSDDSATESVFEEANCVLLVEQITSQVPHEVLASFIKNFLLENNATTVRWQAHALILAIYRNSQPANQETILKLLWHLWPLLPAYGRKALQFVDLLGYFSLRYSELDPSSQIVEYVEKAVEVLKAQNKLLAHHPNASLYANMAQFVELDGYYLESEPCLVCNNPEVPLATIKLSSIRVDSKFTTTTQIVKLLNSHTISKITLRIGDLKRTKMVRTINIFYNNRNVQAVVELKNKPALWHKAKRVVLQSGQTEVKIEFPLAIVACNLMIEYSDFYENIQATSETLQCPRCSAAVPSNPGVCANCGENVFQCHKCRAINYDEKDPFLCHACGFCKYAKFDFTLLARPCCAVESIENDEDRKKMVASINALLEKADRVYKKLRGNKPTLESLLLKISEHRSDKKPEEASPTSSATAGSGMQVNKTIQMLAQQYCTECKTSFEELSKIIQKVLVSRKELVAYDRKHRDAGPSRLSAPILSTDSNNAILEQQHQLHSTSHCYGCSSAATEHCLTLLRALATNPVTRYLLHMRGLIQELVCNNLRKGSIQTQEQVQQLLCILARDNSDATEKLCSLLMDRITNGLHGHIQGSDLGMSIRHEMNLLSVLVQKEDECWEQKLRYMMKLFLHACKESRSPLIMASIILPCLKILQGLMKPMPNIPSPGTASNSANTNGATVGEFAALPALSISVDVCRWLEKDDDHSFVSWTNRLPKKREDIVVPLPKSKEDVRAFYLSEKYGNRWREKLQKLYGLEPPKLDSNAWIKTVMFNPCSGSARQEACNIVECMYNLTDRKKEILVLLTCYLEELSFAGESSAEFLQLYQGLILETRWKQFLAVKGVLFILAKLIKQEIEQLRRLEETRLTSDLAQGYALNQFTELMASFLDDKAIRRQFKGRLVGGVLNGYLSLKRLVVQRTRLIDDTQNKLLELLEEMTTGTEEETKAFMAVCIATVDMYSIHDVLTPVFIFERLCSIIYPEENDIGEFFLTLDKDPQQEDFLQGRMLGNPYSSLEAGLGPLMRDVKNKICMDCELVALLEDDNGMELLVNNKIMSLDLAVKDVYKKVWLAEGGEGDSMRIVYRMRGLLGDATEEFIETLNAKSQETIDNEQVYKMANVLADCDGLKIMVQRLDAISSVKKARPLLQVLLKLFRLSVKVAKVQEVLTQVEIGATSVFLKTLQLCLDSDSALTEQLLDIMETVLSRATAKNMEEFKVFSQTFGGPEYIRALLGCMNSSNVRNNCGVLVHLTRVLAALVYGNEEKMEILINYFKSSLNFNKFDFDHSTEDVQKLEMFCVLTIGIERNSIGNTLKDYIISLGIVSEAMLYINSHAPCVKPTLLRTDSDELKEFISKPALKYILRFLTGLAIDHENTQLAVSVADTIPIIHRLEQVSSDEHVGSLAENLLEALKTNEAVASKIEDVREFTRSEKKRLAMAMREKQLGALGMRTNDKGQVTAKSTILQQMEELGEETGLVCSICREGYKYQPAKVLGIYTFTKRCNIEDFEAKPRKTIGYNTVTHFNVVHVDCHMSAVRLARARDEWESAALQNANTKCNGLLPLWGPQVPESAFASCLARHNTYLQESTNHRDIGYMSTVHDLKLLLLRFAQEKSFHDDTGGGGPQSNMHMVPYLIHMALYVINTTRIAKREETNLTTYLELAISEKWIDSSYETEGPLYWIAMSVLLHSPQKWTTHKVAHLRRLLILGQTRHCHPVGSVKTLADKNVQDYAVYKPYLLFYGLIDGIYNNFFKSVTGPEENWSTNLADYIRHNDEALLKASERLLSTYTDELLPCASFEEFCDVHDLLSVVSNPDTYISDLLQSI